MSRNAFIVCYDIADDGRRTKVHAACWGYGKRLQYSVFRCHLSAVERIDLEVELREIVHQGEDQVLFIDLGPVAGRAERCIGHLGKAFSNPDDGPVIL